MDAARLRSLQPDDLAQQRAFSGTASTEQHHGFPVLDVEIQPIQHTAAVVIHHKIADGNDGHQLFTVK
jgi:hypothetical protein